MKDLKLNDLKRLTKELNEMLFDEDNAIDVKQEMDDLLPLVIEAAELLEGDETAELTEKAQATLKAITAKDDEEEKEDKKSDKKDKKSDKKSDKKKKDSAKKDDNAELIEAIEDCEDLDELKELIKEQDALAGIRKGLGLQKNLEKLQTRALDALENADEVPAKADKKKDAAKKDKKKGPGVIATIVEAVEDAGKKGITRDEVHTILIETFPERNSDSLMNTIKVQLPSRINKEKFEINTLKDGKFAKA